MSSFQTIKAMTKHHSDSAAFERQVAQEFVTGETLHRLSKRHDISRQLIRIWVGKYEAARLMTTFRRRTCCRNKKRKSLRSREWSAGRLLRLSF